MLNRDPYESLDFNMTRQDFTVQIYIQIRNEEQITWTVLPGPMQQITGILYQPPRNSQKTPCTTLLRVRGLGYPLWLEC